jgi:Sec-independent protein translocase protein TatA
MVCAEKIMGLSMSANHDIANITIQIFRGLGKVVGKYQAMVTELEGQLKQSMLELEINQKETQQVLEAAEGLEQQNATNQHLVESLEK